MVAVAVKHFLDRWRERKGKAIDMRPLLLTIQILNKLKTMLKGYKTYVAGTLAIITAIGSYLTDAATLPEALQAILTAVIGMTVRAGISNTAAK